MVEETFEKIKSIEEKARKVIEDAGKSGTKSLINARKKVDAMLADTEKSARDEARAMIERARLEAEAEAREIEKRNLVEVEELRKKTAPKIEEAKKLCR